jgi:hypothetical protein
MTLGSTHDVTALEQFRSSVLDDEALQSELSRIEDTERFVEQVTGAAIARGIHLSPDAVLALMHPDPLGLTRWLSAPPNAVDWPAKNWLPTHMKPYADGQLSVSWAHFGGERLTEPFFEASLRRAIARPFNRVFAYNTSLADFVAQARLDEALAPDGFIFHMSRCGSTLVAQMLAAVPENIVVSEAPPLDVAVRLAGYSLNLSVTEQVRVLTAMVAALGRRRFGAERRFILKLDAWHALALPLIRQAFPKVPWVFLYREPVEVLVSQMRARGLHMVPGGLSPCPFGIEDGDKMGGEEYCARVIEKICTAVVDSLSLAGGLVVNYDELPEAVWTKILPHFGLAYDEAECAEMRRVATRDAKAPHAIFASDKAAKQRQALEPIRAAAKRHLDAVYRSLEAAR